MHGGTVSVAGNGADIGSSFSIRLPIIASQLSGDGKEEVFLKPRQDRRTVARYPMN